MSAERTVAEGTDRDWLQARVNALEQRCAAFEQNQRETAEKLAAALRVDLMRGWDEIGLLKGNHPQYSTLRDLVAWWVKHDGEIEALMDTRILRVFARAGMVKSEGDERELNLDPLRRLARAEARKIELREKAINWGLGTLGASLVTWLVLNIERWSGWLGWLARFFSGKTGQ